MEKYEEDVETVFSQPFSAVATKVIVVFHRVIHIFNEKRE